MGLRRENRVAVVLPNGPELAVTQELGIPTLYVLPVPGAASGVFSLEGEQQSRATQHDFAQPGKVALVLHTLGTTSRPEMVPLMHANLLASARNIRAAYALSPADRCLNVMPLFHIHGLVTAILSTLVSGASVVCTSGSDASRFFDWLVAFRSTWYTAVPTMHQAILKQAEAQSEAIAGYPLRTIFEAPPSQICYGL